MNNEINYSIIIPHKNIPELLQRCLDSIPRRPDVQIIIVDDNSDPEKLDFNAFPGLNDTGIEIIFSKSGKGAGFARNMGLTKATGKWLLFADADDYFTKDFLEYTDKYIYSDYDLIYFGVYRIDIASSRKTNIDYYYERMMQNAIKHNKIDEYKFTGYVPWGKMIGNSLVKKNNILFEETLAANDKLFSIKTAYYAQNIHFDENRIYTYELGMNNNALTSIKGNLSYLERLKANINVNNFLTEILQKKYKINLIPSLKNTFNINDMSFFYEGIGIIKENKMNIFIELMQFCMMFPFQKLSKFINKTRYNKAV